MAIFTVKTKHKPSLRSELVIEAAIFDDYDSTGVDILNQSATAVRPLGDHVHCFLRKGVKQNRSLASAMAHHLMQRLGPAAPVLLFAPSPQSDQPRDRTRLLSCAFKCLVQRPFGLIQLAGCLTLGFFVVSSLLQRFLSLGKVVGCWL